MNIDSKSAAELARLAALSDEELRIDLLAEFDTDAGYAALSDRLNAKMAKTIQREGEEALARGLSVFESNPDNPSEVVEITPNGSRYVVRRDAAGQRVRVRQLS